MRALVALAALATAALPAPVCEALKNKEVVDALCSKVTKFLPQDKCEEAVDLLVSKECSGLVVDPSSGLEEVEALPAPVCEILKNKEVVDMICSKVGSFLPQDKCEEAVDLLVSKECPSEKTVEALPAPVCEVLKNKEVVDMVCSKVGSFLPQDQCEQLAGVLAMKLCPSGEEALPKPVCEILENKQVVDGVCSKVGAFLPQDQCEDLFEKFTASMCDDEVEALPAPVCDVLKNKEVVDAICSKVGSFLPQDKCEEAVGLLVSKECSGVYQHEVEALPAPVCEILKNKEVVDMICSKVGSFLPQDKCEEAVDLLVSKECPSEKAVKALPAPVCEVLKNKEVVDMVCSKVASKFPQDKCEEIAGLLADKLCPSSSTVLVV